MGQRYGCRPSEIIGVNPQLGYSVFFDMAVLKYVAAHEQERQTVGGKLKAKQAGWSPERIRELKAQGLWR